MLNRGIWRKVWKKCSCGSQMAHRLECSFDIFQQWLYLTSELHLGKSVMQHSSVWVGWMFFFCCCPTLWFLRQLQRHKTCSFGSLPDGLAACFADTFSGSALSGSPLSCKHTNVMNFTSKQGQAWSLQQEKPHGPPLSSTFDTQIANQASLCGVQRRHPWFAIIDSPSKATL